LAVDAEARDAYSDVIMRPLAALILAGESSLRERLTVLLVSVSTEARRDVGSDTAMTI